MFREIVHMKVVALIRLQCEAFDVLGNEGKGFQPAFYV